MCIYFTSLNKCCPKDCYPLPRIDQLVDLTAAYALLSCMDAFSGFHQIFMDPAIKEKPAFICSVGVFNYIMMPFGLMNAGATYRRLMDKIFKDQRGRNLELYVDDSIVNSKTEEDMIIDLQETFDNMRKYKMKLHPRKCVFGIRFGKFLGYLVSQRGIDANPEKFQAVINPTEPKSRHEVMQLTGRMTALSRFISTSAERIMSFFKVLKGNKNFEWGEQQSQAFRELKEHLHSLPTLARPITSENLYLYISTTQRTVSTALIKEENKI